MASEPSRAASTSAAPSGCSEPRSAPAARRRTSSSPKSAHARRSVSRGRPAVSVPVLSNATTSTDRALSRAAASWMRIPRPAPRAIPTVSAVGVARPSAHGHAMMRTAIAARSAGPNDGAGPNASHATNVTSAIPSTIGTNTDAMRSTSRWIGGFEDCASSTRRTIDASSVSRPTFVARTRSAPVRFSVPPVTSSPALLSTGTDSPVTIDSSTADDPAITRPSDATVSPGRTTMTSPATRSAIGMSSSSPPARRTRAVFAPSARSARMASPVRARARASRNRPTRMSAMIPVAVS